jgi:hypothetical protein
MTRRIENLDWLPIELASRDLKVGSGQVVVLYRPHVHGSCLLEYTTSNPDYAMTNAAKHGYTEFALLVDG